MSDDPLRIDEYRPGDAVALTDAERWPTLDAAGAARLEAVRHHPAAPRWTHVTGDRLTASQLELSRHSLPLTGWLDDHLAVARKLPAYRRLPGLDSLADFPTIGRADLVENLWAYVPLDADLDAMVHGSSSGATGAALMIPDDIVEVARGFHLLVDLVRAEGVDWRPDPGRMALMNLVLQHQAFTYASVISGFDQAAMARVNLAVGEWPYPGARADFLAANDPQVVTGDPATLVELLEPDLRPRVRPLALFSGAMALTAPVRARLEQAFDCPVFDVYGLHETRPIAVRTDDGPFRLLDRRLVVEILDAEGRPVPEGETGEIVVTAGENPLLPLVRYRTGDFARLVDVGGRPHLADLEGRENTIFATADGGILPTVDLTQQLQAHGALGWTVEQDEEGQVVARIVQGDAAAVGAALDLLFGRRVEVRQFERLADLGPGKPRRYRSGMVRDPDGRGRG